MLSYYTIIAKHNEASEKFLLPKSKTQVSLHTKMHSKCCMYFDTIYINFIIKSSWTIKG